MKALPCVWRSTSARGVALGLVIALAPLPLVAAETSQPIQPVASPAAAMFSRAATERLVTPLAGRAQSQAAGATQTELESPAFFKTRLGMAVIAIVGAGALYAVYSANHDRIHSSAR